MNIILAYKASPALRLLSGSCGWSVLTFAEAMAKIVGDPLTTIDPTEIGEANLLHSMWLLRKTPHQQHLGASEPASHISQALWVLEPAAHFGDELRVAHLAVLRCGVATIELDDFRDHGLQPRKKRL